MTLTKLAVFFQGEPTFLLASGENYTTAFF